MKYYDLIQTLKNSDREFIKDQDLVNELSSQSTIDWKYIRDRLWFLMRIIKADILENSQGLSCKILTTKGQEVVLLQTTSFTKPNGDIVKTTNFKETLTQFLAFIKSEHESFASNKDKLRDLILTELQSFMTSNKYKFNDIEVDFTSKFYKYLWSEGYSVYKEVEIDASSPSLKNKWTDAWRPDLLFVFGDQYVPVEFKYQKDGTLNQTLAYDFWKDVYKLQQLKQCTDFNQGLAIFVAPKSYFATSLCSYKKGQTINSVDANRPNFDINVGVGWEIPGVDVEYLKKTIPMQLRCAQIK